MAAAWHRIKAVPIKLADLVRFAKGDSITRANGRALLHEELGIRFAQQSIRVERLATFPGLRPACSVALQNVSAHLARSLDDLVLVDKKARRDEETHIRTFARIKDRHLPDMAIVARAFRTLCARLDSHANMSQAVDSALDDYFKAGLGINLLIDQTLAVHPRSEGKGTRTGIVDEAINVMDIVTDAAEVARDLCEREHGDAPDVNCKGPPEVHCHHMGNASVAPTVAGVPHLIHMATLEIVKNAVRASAENALDKCNMAPVDIGVAQAKEDVTIIVDDKAGGIPRSKASRLLYGYCRSSAPPPLEEDDCGRAQQRSGLGAAGGAEASPLAGFGVGLPFSRAQMRLFGGDIHVMSVHGVGTRVAIFLPRNALTIPCTIPLSID